MPNVSQQILARNFRVRAYATFIPTQHTTPLIIDSFLCPVLRRLAATHFSTYYVDLRELNRDEKTNFTLEYSMREAYGLPIIDPTSMSQLVLRLKTDDALFAKYVEYNSVRWTSEALAGDRRCPCLRETAHFNRKQL